MAPSPSPHTAHSASCCFVKNRFPSQGAKTSRCSAPKLKSSPKSEKDKGEVNKQSCSTLLGQTGKGLRQSVPCCRPTIGSPHPFYWKTVQADVWSGAGCFWSEGRRSEVINPWVKSGGDGVGQGGGGGGGGRGGGSGGVSVGCCPLVCHKVYVSVHGNTIK